MSSRRERIADLKRQLEELDTPQTLPSPEPTPQVAQVEASKPTDKVVDHAPTFDDLRSQLRDARDELHSAQTELAACASANQAALQRVSTAHDAYISAVDALVEAA